MLLRILQIVFSGLFFYFYPSICSAQAEQKCMDSQSIEQIAYPEADPSWTAPEKWAWDQIRRGENASFNKLYCIELDPSASDKQWFSTDKNRNIRGKFIVSLLQDPKYVKIIPAHGIIFEGARITGGIDADALAIGAHVFIHKSRVQGSINLSFATLDRSLIIQDSHIFGSILAPFLNSSQAFFLYLSVVTGNIEARSSNLGAIGIDITQVNGHVILDNMRVSGSATFEKSLFKKDFRAAGAIIGTQFNAAESRFTSIVHLGSMRTGTSINLEQSKVGGHLIMEAVHVGTSVSLYQAEFKGAVILENARVTGQVSIHKINVSGDFVANSSRIEGGLSIGESKFLQRIILSSVALGSNISIRESEVEQQFIAEGLNCRGDGIIQNSKFKRPVDIARSVFDGKLDLGGSRFDKNVDLSASTIRGSLTLGSKKDGPAIWAESAQLFLMNTTSGSIQDYNSSDSRFESWPSKGNLRLEGFKYTRIGGSTSDESTDMVQRSGSFFTEWLALTPRFTSQPYIQLAEVLRSYGLTSAANDVLLAGRERARSETDWVTWFGLSILKITTGYGIGHGYLYSLGWVVFLTVMGGFILYHNSYTAWKNGLLWSLWASFDEILPLVSLKHDHQAAIEEINPKLRWFFYLQRIFAYVLGTFVAAGVVGLTQS